MDAVPARERPTGGEEEADRVVPGEADVAVRPVRDVLHQPVDAHQGGGVDVEGRTCCQGNREENLKLGEELGYFLVILWVFGDFMCL